MTSKDLDVQLRSLPEKPGIYQYYNQKGEVIYVGKAKNIKKRVNSYFTKSHDNRKTQVLVRKIASIRTIVVDTEYDALLLENSLIKEHQPRYNIQLKDDKTYPWIVIKNEPFPRVFPTRQKRQDGSQYFGPYASVKSMHRILDLIRETYPLRTCQLDLSQKNIESGKFKVCLEFHIGKCKGPCEGLEKAVDYDSYINEIREILRGNVAPLVQQLQKSMKRLADQYDFEEAQKVKSRIDALTKYKNKSQVVSGVIGQLDVLTILPEQETVFFNYLMVKDGAIINGYSGELKNPMMETEEDVMVHLYQMMREKFESGATDILVERAPNVEQGVKWLVPQRGEKKQLLELSINNAKHYKLEKRKMEKIVSPEKHHDRIMRQIQQDFKIPDLPVHMECFDNSNIQGTHPVSACVVFKQGKPSKKDYRHFNVKTVEGPDDFATMREVIYRRYKRLLEEGESLPQLVVIDGGKGQLSAAMESVEELGLRGKMVVVGIAKRLEEIFYPGDSLPMYLDKRSESLKVIQHMRNEAHRFGITHHRNKRSKSALQSKITELQGIGPKTQELLLKKFKSIKGIQKASDSELMALIGASKSKIVRQAFPFDPSET